VVVYGRTLLAVAEADVPLSDWDYTPYTAGYAHETVREILDELTAAGLAARVGDPRALSRWTLTTEGRAAAAALVRSR
jgi:hypothetical protein